MYHRFKVLSSRVYFELIKIGQFQVKLEYYAELTPELPHPNQSSFTSDLQELWTESFHWFLR